MLIGRVDGVGSGVIGLLKDVLLVGEVLKIEGGLEGALLILLAIRYAEVGSEVGTLTLAVGQVIAIYRAAALV